MFVNVGKKTASAEKKDFNRDAHDSDVKSCFSKQSGGVHKPLSQVS